MKVLRMVSIQVDSYKLFFSSLYFTVYFSYFFKKINPTFTFKYLT